MAKFILEIEAEPYHNVEALKSIAAQIEESPMDFEKQKHIMQFSGSHYKASIKKTDCKYSLVCINEEPSVVSVEVFATIKEARKQMAKEAKRERKESEGNGYTTECHIEGNYASVSTEENGCYYIWNIDAIR